MNKLPTKLIAIVLLISTAGSSMASESMKVVPSLQFSAGAEKLSAPTTLAQKAAFDASELMQYRVMSARSQTAVTRKSAGASDTSKTVLTVVGLVVVGLGVVLLVISHGGKGIPVGNVGNAFTK